MAIEKSLRLFSNRVSDSSYAFRHSFLHMYVHAVSILGTAPLLMAVTYELARVESMGPDSVLPLRVFAFTLFITLRLKHITCSTKSALSSYSSILARFCKFYSFVSGRIMVQQSRSLKNCFISRLIRFFCSTASENPFCISRAFSR